MEVLEDAGEPARQAHAERMRGIGQEQQAAEMLNVNPPQSGGNAVVPLAAPPARFCRFRSRGPAVSRDLLLHAYYHYCRGGMV